MIDPSTSIAVAVAAMLLLVVVRGVGRGEVGRPSCPLCGSRTSSHARSCPWRGHEPIDRS